MFSIKRRLTIGLLLLLGFLAIQTGVFSYNESRLHSNLDSTISKNTQLSSMLATASVFSQKIRRFEKEYFIYVQDIEQRKSYTAQWNDAVGRVETTLTELHENKQQLLPAEEAAQIKSWLEAMVFYKSEMQKIFVAVEQQNSEQNLAAAIKSAPAGKTKTTAATSDVKLISPNDANARIAVGKDRFTNVLVMGVTNLGAAKTKETLDLTKMVDRSFNELTFIFAALALADVLVVVLLLVTLPRAVSKPLEELSEAVDQMSRGNVKQPAPQTNVKEFVGLTAALERLRTSQAILLTRLGNR